MSTLASLRILLGLDSGDVSKGAGRVRQELTGVQRSANLARDSLRGVAAGFGLGAGIGAFQLASRAVGEFTDLIGDSVKAAIAEEAGIKRLDQSLKANVAGWDGNRAAIERVIEARQALGFADDEQRDAMARALVATNDVARAQDVLATAMDLARLKGIDLGSATDALIKIEGGQFRALKALGIELKAGATQTEALAAVQKVAAGQAEEFAGTTAGAMAAAGIEVENLKEDFGALLAGPVKDLANFLRTELIHGLREAADGMRDFGSSTGDLLGPVGDLAGEIDRLTAPLFVTLQLIPQIGVEIHNLIVGTTEMERAAIKAGTATLEWVTAERALLGDMALLVPAVKEFGVDILTAGNGADDAGANLRHFAGDVRGLTQDLGDATTALRHFNDEAGKVPSQINVTQDFDPTHPGGAPAGLHPGANKAALDAIAAAEKAARDAETAANKAARDAEAAANKAARDAEQAAAKRAAEEAQRHAWALADQFDAAKDKARDYFDALHESNQKAIDDIRDRANEELTAQQKAIRGVVSAEQARINAVRAREQENTLRGAVAEAETPDERSAAQRDLNRFLEDQRLGRMSANADIAVALIDQEKAKNDAIAAEATKAENDRAADQRAAFDDEIAALQKNLSRHPELWANTTSAILKLLDDSVPLFAAVGEKAVSAYIDPLKKLGLLPSVSATSPNATAPTAGLGSAAGTTFTLVQHIYIDGVLDRVERGQATLQSIYNPLPVSTGSQR